MFKRLFAVLLVNVLGLAFVVGCTSRPVMLADQGESPYRIVIAEDAPASVAHGAAELQQFLEQITQAKLPIVTDASSAQPNEILLGQSKRLDALNLDLDPATLGKEGYLLRTVGPRLVIVGGGERGTLYGVYGLLEDHLGCRWFTPDVSHIPSLASLALPELDEQKTPVLEYRDVFTYDNHDGAWSVRNRVNSRGARLTDKHGGKVTFGRGYFVHTFERMVPPEKYFETNPEYFSLINGKRVGKRSQLCTTNEEVIQLCIDAVRKAMREQPDATVFSVSQNDWFNYCQCDTCQAVAKREGSQIGPVLEMVNRVADAVKDEFPDKAVETLAYQWTRQPPKTIRPRENVIVRLCTIECSFSHPLNESDHPANIAFCKDAEGWSTLTDRLWVWDYATNFRHYLMPFPNQRLRDDNIRYLISQNVKGIMAQDVYNTPHSEMVELGGYLTAKFLWDPDYDEAKATTEFLDAYYGNAAAPIAAYLDLMHDYVQDNNIQVGIFDGIGSPHLADDLLIQADALWQQAEDAVADDSALLERVKRSRLSPDYAIIERTKLQYAKQDLAVNPALLELARKRVEPYLKTLDASDLTRIEEWKVLDFDAYAKRTRAVLTEDQ